MEPDDKTSTHSSVPNVSVPGPAVFLAAPYEQLLDPGTSLVALPWQDRLEALRTGLLRNDLAVFNAHYNEQWGDNWLPPNVCTRLDFAAMQAADVVCAVIGVPASGGVAVELGWASALGTPCVLLLEARSRHTSLIRGLGAIVDVVEIVLPEDWSPRFVDTVVKRVASLAGRERRRFTEVGPSTAGFVRAQIRGESL